MANYSAAEDVSVLLGLDNFSTSTQPTLAQVNTIIADITNEIDFVLASAGINSQPTDARILARLKIACKLGVAAQVGYSAFGNNTGTENTQPNKYWLEYQRILEEIRTQPELYGVIAGSETVYISNPVGDGTTTEEKTTDKYLEQDYKY